MTRWTFSGSKIKSATRISPKLSDVNPFAFAPPQLSKWPHVKVPPREYVEYALGQTFEAYNRFYEGVDTLGEGADGGESLNRSGKNGRGKPPPIVRVNGIPFRMHELFEAICTRPMPPERAQEQEQEQIEVRMRESQRLDHSQAGAHRPTLWYFSIFRKSVEISVSCGMSLVTIRSLTAQRRGS